MRVSTLGGYVLAGGRSSRMGTDKALLQFAGRPLIEHAVTKVRSLCGDAHILGSDSALAEYGPMVGDLHPGCGPIGGMEAALDHSPYAWNLFLPVDMPLLPTALLRSWMARWSEEEDAARIRIFEAEGGPQPGFCLLHKEVLPYLTESILSGEYKLMRAFEVAACGLARQRGVAPEEVLWRHSIEEEVLSKADSPRASDAFAIREAQLAASRLWFANLNTPENFAEAETHLAALDD